MWEKVTYQQRSDGKMEFLNCGYYFVQKFSAYNANFFDSKSASYFALYDNYTDLLQNNFLLLILRKPFLSSFC